MLLLSGLCCAFGMFNLFEQTAPTGLSSSVEAPLHKRFAPLFSKVKGTFLRLGFVRAFRQSSEEAQLLDVCNKEMPELLDILSLGLSAGLSFDAALEMYCASSATSLSNKMREAMTSWQMGLYSRREALQKLSERLNVVSLQQFCFAVCEALSFGAPLAATLERQSDALREEQRSLTQERIEEVPVRMLVPLGTLVVPAMLLAILGPLLAAAF